MAVPSLSPGYGGPSAKARHLSTALGDLGVEVVVVGCGQDPSWVGLPILARFHSNDIPARLAPLRRAVRHADIVHVLGFREPVSALSELFAVLGRKALVIEPVGTHRPRLRTFRLKALFDRTAGALFMRRAVMVVATSRAERDDLVADGVPAEKIRLRPNGIAVDHLRPLPEAAGARAGLGVPRGSRLVVSLGRIIGIKGLPQIGSALAGLPDDVRAYVGGPDEGDGTVSAISAAARSAGVEERLIVRPEGIWGDEKRALMAAASVFCLPSESESFGTAAAEAAALGVPVVCSTTSGIAEWLESDSFATFEYGDIDHLQAALQKMLEADAWVAAQRNGPVIEERLSWPSIATRQMAFYEEVLAAAAAA